MIPTAPAVVDLISREDLDALPDGQAVRVASEVRCVEPQDGELVAQLNHLAGVCVVLPTSVHRACPDPMDPGAFLQVEGRIRRGDQAAVVLATRVRRDRTREGDFPPLVDAPYVMGFDHRGRRHAIEHRIAAKAIHAATAAGHPRHPTSFPVCLAGQVLVVSKLGAFDRATEPTAARPGGVPNLRLDPGAADWPHRRRAARTDPAP